MGHAWWKDCLHVNFGLMKIKEGDEVLAMSTRGGQMVPLNELLDRMVAVVRAIIEEKNPELAPEQKASVAEAVGVGAVVFWVQARRRATDTVFDWKKATDPSGDSAPYLQYTHARCRSIARKAAAECGPSVAAPDFHLLTEKEETETAHLLGRWPDILRDAARDNEPSKIASYLLDLAGCWSNFLNKHHVLKSENADLRTARLALVDSVRFVLAEGLRLLGVAAPEEM
jgi:arginyl-tRNA synthetase